MSAFQLDTSGEVGGKGLPVLTDFQRGYVEALVRAALLDRYPYIAEFFGPEMVWAAALCDLDPVEVVAPETLQQIIADCERFAALYGDWPLVEHGRGFWVGRARGKHSPEFWPLHPTLSEDGKVRFQHEEVGS